MYCKVCLKEVNETTYCEVCGDGGMCEACAEGGDRTRQEVAERLQDMTPAERRLLREAIDRLDDWFDVAALDSYNSRK